jgi:3-oxoacyl-[acyl-carrier-protein] synthase-1
MGKSTVAEGLFAGSGRGIVESHKFLASRRVCVGLVGSDLPTIPRELAELSSRNNQLILAAMSEIAGELSAAVTSWGADRVGVVMGTSTSGVGEGEHALADRLSLGSWPGSFDFLQQEPGSISKFVADYWSLLGPAYTISTACSSTGKAFAAARRMLRFGLCDVVIVGGADSLCRLTLTGFAAMEAISEGVCNPFSINRDGITIGEGAAVFLMSREPSEVELLGVGETSDAHHISAPDPTGQGARNAMALALASAGLEPDDICYINLHGTGTRLNDSMEALAVSQIFGSEISVSSTKPLSGHLLGAAGATEAAFLWLALHDAYDDLLPQHQWDGVEDPELPKLRFVDGNQLAKIPRRSAMMSNSFAFGGSNACVLLGRGW